MWADLWPALRVFFAMQTQWHIAEGIETGLRYEVLPFMFKTHGIQKKDRADMLTDLKTCERAALDCWSKHRGQG